MGERVAVAVVSWNTAALLRRCLASLADDAAAGTAEVWVVDNGSTDDSVAVAESFGFARVVALEENLGFALAVNHVAERTATPWIACANADIAFTPGALARLLECGAAHPRAGAVAPRLRLPGGTTQHSVHAFPSARVMAAHGSGIGRLAPGLAERFALEGHWDPARPREVDWAVGALLLVRRQAWEAAGGFEPDPRLYGEDLDLGWRLARAGWTTRYEPAAVVEHAQSAATAKRWGNARYALETAATYRWLVHRRGRRRAFAVGAVAVAGAAARALVWLVRAPGTPRWKACAGEARLHAGALRHALARHL
jgi:GT2 family glycosyltransferase